VDPREDIKKERTKATFKVSELTEFLAGGKEVVARQKVITDALTSYVTYASLLPPPPTLIVIVGIPCSVVTTCASCRAPSSTAAP